MYFTSKHLQIFSLENSFLIICNTFYCLIFRRTGGVLEVLSGWRIEKLEDWKIEKLRLEAGGWKWKIDLP